MSGAVVDQAASTQVEVDYYINGKTSALFPSGGNEFVKEKFAKMINEYCTSTASVEFFNPDCAFANGWVSKKENKGKKAAPAK